MPLFHRSPIRNAFLMGAFACLSTFARAQELGLAAPKQEAVLKVVGITQFATGHIVRTEESLAQTDVVYQTPIYEGDRIETTSGSVAKFATRTGCLFVLHGEGAIAAPTERKPWRMRGESLRLICRNRSAPETFGVSNAPVSIKDGEILFLSKRSKEKSVLHALLLSGSATVHGQPLELHKLYSIEAAKISEVTPQPDDTELRQLNLDQNPPREAYEWPAPEKKYTVRLIFGPVFSGDRVDYDASDFSQSGLRSTNPRFQVHLRTRDDRSFIVAATFRDSKDNSKESSPNSPPPVGVATSLEQELLEIGYRSHHDRWWSPYWRLGGGYTKAKIADTVNNGGGGTWSTRYDYEFYVVSAAYGIDAHLTPHFLRPFGLYAGLEGQVVQSVFRGGRFNENNGNFSTPPDPAEPRRLTQLDVSAALGLQYDF